MSIIRQLSTAFTGIGVNAPKLIKVDKIESAGSLLLLDLTHPYKPTKSGVLVNGDVLPNLVGDTLTALNGSSANIDASMGQQIGTPQRINTERTTMGGVHGIVQQTAGTIVTGYYHVGYPQAVLDYMNANKGHSYYISLWQRTTRASTYLSGGLYPTYQELASGGSGITLVYQTNGQQQFNPAMGYNNVSPNSEINHLFASGLPGVHSTGVLATQSKAWMVGGEGAWNASGASGSQDKLPSQVFYRTYIEDLTVSGRLYSDVFAIDNAQYTKEVLNVGGRYYGDTFTAPSSVVFPA